MKEDYLWDKTGKDSEIERLETALQAFRYRETAPPELPAKIISLKNEMPRQSFRWWFSFAAFAALAIVLAGVWFQTSDNKIEVAKNPLETIAPPIEKKIPDEQSFAKPPFSVIKNRVTPKKSVERKIVKTGKLAAAIDGRNYLTAGNSKIKTPPVKLTAEEKYAYNQLMLALSITSSQLKLVKDKIEGIEEPKAVLENAR